MGRDDHLNRSARSCLFESACARVASRDGDGVVVVQRRDRVINVEVLHPLIGLVRRRARARRSPERSTR